jgi:hypothetical protein
VFGVDPAQSCAITDVSIRVEPDGRETVTYCGISSHGDPGLGTPLTPKLPAAVTPGPAGVWDGIVGRVSRSAAGAKTVEFHTNVLTAERDGLFGLAEVEVDYTTQPIVDRFVAVGAVAIAGSGTNSGAAMRFDAAPTRATPTPGDLVLDSVAVIGVPIRERNTIARDVVVLRDGFFDQVTSRLQNVCVVVGSTDDVDLFSGLPWPAPAPHAGGVDGFVMLATDAPAGLMLQGGAFFGGPDDDGFTGVQGWNEYPDEFVAAGFTHGPAGGVGQDIGLASYYLDSSVGGVSPTSIRVVRQDEVGGATAPAGGGSSTERTAGMGLVQALTVGLPFLTFGLDDPAGGGVAVDQRARVNVVGYTDADDYLTGFPGIVGRARDPWPPADAVRTVYDMLPPPRSTQPFGVGRTDLSGQQGPFVLPAGFTGGTTPACALSPFGRRIGDPPPLLARILVDYEGPAPQAGVAGGFLIASRPSNFVFTAWQWDIPGAVSTAPALLLLPPLINGVEYFVPDSIANGAIFLAGFALPGQSTRVLVNFAVPVPLPGQTMTVQVLSWAPFAQPGGLTCTGSDTTETVGSVAMWLPLL